MRRMCFCLGIIVFAALLASWTTPGRAEEKLIFCDEFKPKESCWWTCDTCCEKSLRYIGEVLRERRFQPEKLADAKNDLEGCSGVDSAGIRNWGCWTGSFHTVEDWQALQKDYEKWREYYLCCQERKKKLSVEKAKRVYEDLLRVMPEVRGVLTEDDVRRIEEVREELAEDKARRPAQEPKAAVEPSQEEIRTYAVAENKETLQVHESKRDQSTGEPCSSFPSIQGSRCEWICTTWLPTIESFFKGENVGDQELHTAIINMRTYSGVRDEGFRLGSCWEGFRVSFRDKKEAKKTLQTWQLFCNCCAQGKLKLDESNDAEMSEEERERDFRELLERGEGNFNIDPLTGRPFRDGQPQEPQERKLGKNGNLIPVDCQEKEVEMFYHAWVADRKSGLGKICSASKGVNVVHVQDLIDPKSGTNYKILKPLKVFSDGMPAEFSFALANSTFLESYLITVSPKPKNGDSCRVMVEIVPLAATADTLESLLEALRGNE